MVKERFSGIELLKVIAVLLIVMSHAVPFSSTGVLSDGTVVNYMLNLDLATTNIQEFICNIIRYGGQLGNAIFVVCSSWFLLDSKKVKMDKVLQIVLDAFLLSVGILIVYLLIGYHFDLVTIFKQLLPITLKNNWYVTCYLLFYLVHPFLNLIVNHASKKELFMLNAGMFFIYSIVGSIFLESFFYTQLIGFIEIYFIVAYIKLYLMDYVADKRKNIKMLVSCFILYFVLILFTNIVGLHVGFMSNKMLHWCYFYNPFMVGIAISLFDIFYAMKFKNKFVNYLSSLSLFVYIIHTNNLYVHYTFLQSYAFIYKQFSFDYILLEVIAYGCVLLFVSFVLAAIYDVVKKFVCQTRIYKKAISFVENMISGCLEKCYNFLR